MSVSVNGHAISEREINLESAHHAGGDPAERQKRAAVALVIRELLLERVREKQFQPADEEQAIEALLDAEVPAPVVEENACRRYFEANRETFRSPDLVEARHILLAAHPEDHEGRDQARAQAEALVDQLRRQPAGFEPLAAEHSACPSKAQGGSLGQISRGQTVPEFENVLLRLPVGLAERPIESRYGYHVVEVVQRVEGQALPFEVVRPQIERYLTDKSRRKALGHYLQRLAAAADIDGIDLGVDAGPLMQ